jgi:hypothetical protein
MKGLVFTTFYDFCSREFGEDTLDDVITASQVPNDGAYTSVGTYPFEEMVSLIAAFCKITDQEMPQVLDDFGRFCFSKWVSYSPEFFDGRSLFDVLESIDDFHENEVKKLYPDAELPSFKILDRTDNVLSLRYESCKPLGDLAGGVIAGASSYLNTPVVIERSLVTQDDDAYVRFDIVRIV